MAQEPITQWEVPTAPEPGYNGWTNWETWNVALWLGNEPGTSAYLYELSNRKQLPVYTLADMLEAQVKTWWYDTVEAHQLPESSMWADLMIGTLDKVDWREIVDNNREAD